MRLLHIARKCSIDVLQVIHRSSWPTRTWRSGCPMVRHKCRPGTACTPWRRCRSSPRQPRTAGCRWQARTAFWSAATGNETAIQCQITCNSAGVVLPTPRRHHRAAFNTRSRTQRPSPSPRLGGPAVGKCVGWAVVAVLGAVAAGVLPRGAAVMQRMQLGRIG